VAPPSKYTDMSSPWAPGDYEVTIKGTLSKNINKSKTSTFKLTLEDPCDPPISITAPASYANGVSYTLYTEVDYQADEWTSNPSYCAISYTGSIGDFEVGGSEAIPASAITKT
jgi:hypothetical protein